MVMDYFAMAMALASTTIAVLVVTDVYFTPCPHQHIRCIHGDEINHANGRRARCLDCHSTLDRGLPGTCFYTKQPHWH